uniref:Uncharacterized protein n=1 Tax=Cannabis sativa TaxID=3483 RepID=A0A803PIP6_CANSA
MDNRRFGFWIGYSRMSAEINEPKPSQVILIHYLFRILESLGKKAPLDTVMKEADSLAPSLQLGGVREEGTSNVKNRGKDAKNLYDGVDDDQNPKDSEEEDDDDGYVKDGYHKDSYYYDHDPNLLHVTRKLEATQIELAGLKKLTGKMKRMMDHLQNKFKDLAESNDDPSVEVMAKERALGQIEVETSNPHKDKGKGKVGEPTQKSAPKPPQKDPNPPSQPSKMQKATGSFESGRPSAPRGKVVPKGQSTKVPKPKGQKNHTSDSVNRDRRKTGGHMEDSCPL